MAKLIGGAYIFINKKKFFFLEKYMKRIVLSLDGGGARGLFSLNILLLLKQNLTRPLYQSFNLVVGSSIGAVVGSLVACRMLDEKKDILDRTLDIGKSIFDTSVRSGFGGFLEPIYNGKSKRAGLKQLFGELKMSDVSIPLCIVTTHMNGTPKLIKSWENGDVLIYEALDASTAAPVFFPPVEVKGEYLVDGGCISNNPVAIAMLCSLQLKPGDMDFKILSIATKNIRTYKKLDETSKNKLGLSEWIKRDLIGMLMGSNDTTVTDLAKMILGNENVLRLFCDVTTSLNKFDNNTIQLLFSETHRVWHEEKEIIIKFVEPNPRMECHRVSVITPSNTIQCK